MSVTGGCLCGAIRYTYDGPVGEAVYCHCADCRRVTGGAFNIGVGLEAASFSIVGAAKHFTKRGDSGGELTRHFCGDCGSPLYTASLKHPEKVYVKAGTLDDPTLVKPAAEIWTASSVTWARIPPGLARYSQGR